MALVEVSCPRCHAPVDMPAGTDTVKCRFCGTTLRDVHGPKPIVHTRSVPFLFLERVGPSNFARAWDVLTKIGRVAPDVAERAIRSSPGDVASFEGFTGGDELIAALREAGITARFEDRRIEVPPPPPDRSVHLDAVGSDKVAVMKAIREHMDCGVYEAKAVIERAPCLLVAALAGERAAAFVEALKAAGADARLDAPR
jgi:ribosomal protein L7/L12